MERKLTRIYIPWCNACQEKECHSSNGECAMIRIYQKAKVPTQNPWCDICGKDDCDKIICGFTTCEIISELSKLKNFIRKRANICPYEIDEYGNITREPCGSCLICTTINDNQS